MHVTTIFHVMHATAKQQVFFNPLKSCNTGNSCRSTDSNNNLCQYVNDKCRNIEECRHSSVKYKNQHDKCSVSTSAFTGWKEPTSKWLVNFCECLCVALTQSRSQWQMQVNNYCHICATSHAGTVVPGCYKDDVESQWKSLKFDPPPPSIKARAITSCIRNRRKLVTLVTSVTNFLRFSYEFRVNSSS